MPATQGFNFATDETWQFEGGSGWASPGAGRCGCRGNCGGGCGGGGCRGGCSGGCGTKKSAGAPTLALQDYDGQLMASEGARVSQARGWGPGIAPPGMGGGGVTDPCPPACLDMVPMVERECCATDPPFSSEKCLDLAHMYAECIRSFRAERSGCPVPSCGSGGGGGGGLGSKPLDDEPSGGGGGNHPTGWGGGSCCCCPTQMCLAYGNSTYTEEWNRPFSHGFPFNVKTRYMMMGGGAGLNPWEACSSEWWERSNGIRPEYYENWRVGEWNAAHKEIPMRRAGNLSWLAGQASTCKLLTLDPSDLGLREHDDQDTPEQRLAVAQALDIFVRINAGCSRFAAIGRLCDACCLLMGVYWDSDNEGWSVFARGPVCGPVCEAFPGGLVGLAVAENPQYGPMWQLKKGPVGGRRARSSSRRCNGDE